MSESMAVNKVTLSSGKVVLLRDFKIKHYELAISVAGKRAGKNELLSGWLMQQELLKLLIVQIDGKDVPKASLESLDEIFSAKEFTQLCKVVKSLIGEDENAEGADDPKLEVVSFGSK